jgi:thioester reductase-like protein
MNQTALLTGFPGFIGKRLVAKLLKDDPQLQIIVLVEPRMVAQATTAARTLGENVVVESGDITEPCLGLPMARYRQLTKTVSRVFHLAAIYDLAVPEAVAEAVNVTGTRHVLDFCRACGSLERHHYVSTAYVAGTRKGRVLESELAEGQSFKNHYESTKHRAEVLVRETMPTIRTTIYRPGIVVGDSRTGATQKFDGPYYLLRFVALLSRLHLPLPQIASQEATFNAVPVDFIVDAIAAGVRDELFVGETLHLVDPSPVPAGELLRLLARAYAGKEL